MISLRGGERIGKKQDRSVLHRHRLSLHHTSLNRCTEYVLGRPYFAVVTSLRLRAEAGALSISIC